MCSLPLARTFGLFHGSNSLPTRETLGAINPSLRTDTVCGTLPATSQGGLSVKIHSSGFIEINMHSEAVVRPNLVLGICCLIPILTDYRNNESGRSVCLSAEPVMDQR